MLPFSIHSICKCYQLLVLSSIFSFAVCCQTATTCENYEELLHRPALQWILLENSTMNCYTRVIRLLFLILPRWRTRNLTFPPSMALGHYRRASRDCYRQWMTTGKNILQGQPSSAHKKLTELVASWIRSMQTQVRQSPSMEGALDTKFYPKEQLEPGR